jgi:LPS-assembly lipoprotein
MLAGVLLLTALAGCQVRPLYSDPVGTSTAIKSGNRTAVALVDFPVQEFAKLRAVRDGENRAAKELAELIRADIAAALSR